jgi:hypothetical protein
MVQASSASRFWSAVQDCLVEFHQFDRERAAENVTAAWRRIPWEQERKPTHPSFDDMIYHAEPWSIACNLAGNDFPIGPNEPQYRQILRQNHLA